MADSPYRWPVGSVLAVSSIQFGNWIKIVGHSTDRYQRPVYEYRYVRTPIQGYRAQTAIYKVEVARAHLRVWLPLSIGQVPKGL